MAEFDIGAHCAYIDCKQIDFLPIQCDACKQIFCKLHSSMISHHCTEERRTVASLPSKSTVSHASNCQFSSCGRLEVIPLICEACGGQFCITHKQKEVHHCPNLWTATDEAIAIRKAGLEASSHLNRSALETVSRSLNQTGKPATKKSVANTLGSAKQMSGRARTTAARLSLVKTKMEAQPAGRSAASLAPEERFVLRLASTTDLLSSSVSSPAEIPVFFGKNWPLGKLLDFAQEKFDIKSVPNQHLGLFHVTDDSAAVPLDLSRNLAEYERQGTLVEGCLIQIANR
ncbi:hypothetical protein EG68_11300 [Paragonimus skrjabini miyazakii]|uniref:AN1-type domain-containing protein n=1 Tax=Paragonimus skrjabini miyazakii TaxID=59628 RepID=A0A8S9YEL2_9TREM|nr:hypothetical protein EG68_11300 [Paragonimus skrjabini miyazakii]